MGRRRVLITGGAGLVGSILRSHWGDRDELLLVSNVDVTTQQKIDQRDY